MGRADWRRYIWWAAVLGVAAILAVVGFYLHTRGLQDAANIAQLVSVVIALPALLIALFAWRRRFIGDPRSGDFSAAVKWLATTVKLQWDGEAWLWGLGEPVSIPVRWEVTKTRDLMDIPVNVTNAPLETFSVTSDDIGALATGFQMLSKRRMVILGESGVGKTSLAVMLLRQLLADRQPNESVPVLLSAADWDFSVDRTLGDWVTSKLRKEYPALMAPEYGGEEGPGRLVRSKLVIPIIDGLDELPPPAQAAFLAMVRTSLDADDSLILTCRTEEFSATVDGTGNVISSALVLEPEPIDGTVAADYLERCLHGRVDTEWLHLLAILRTADGSATDAAVPLVANASTALGLWLVRTVYLERRRDPSELLDQTMFPDPSSLRAHLLAKVIPSLVMTRTPSSDPADVSRPSRQYNPEDVLTWLQYLAHLLSHRMPLAAGRSGPDRHFLWWLIASTVNDASSAMKRTVSLAVGIATLIIVSGFALITDDKLTLVLVLFAVGINVAFLGIDIEMKYREWRTEWPGLIAAGTRTHLMALIRTIAFTGGPYLAAYTLIYLVHLVSGSEPRPAGAVTLSDIALTFGILALIRVIHRYNQLLAVPSVIIDATTPMTIWRSARRVTLIQVAVAAAAGAAAAVALCVHFDLPIMATTAVAVAAAILTGLLAGLMPGIHHAWPAYVIAIDCLARDRRLPRDLMRFLDDAHRLGLLRAIGPAYQFRHTELQDHLAASYVASHAHDLQKLNSSLTQHDP
jgi:hypothetical protein